MNANDAWQNPVGRISPHQVIALCRRTAWMPNRSAGVPLSTPVAAQRGVRAPSLIAALQPPHNLKNALDRAPFRSRLSRALTIAAAPWPYFKHQISTPTINATVSPRRTVVRW
jgi:hypothetical protein